MNSSTIKIKKFLSNRNTVAFICGILAVVVLFVAYNWRIRNAIDPIQVPVAKVDIQPRTEITDDMVEYKQFTSAALDNENVIVKGADVIGKYSKVNTMIPQGSLFYNSAIVDQEDRADYYVDQTPKDYVLHYIPVNTTTSYSNSILPGRYIDIYLSTGNTTANEDETYVEGGKVMVSMFIQNVKVLAVKTSSGENVFENSEETRVPAQLIVAVPKRQYLLLKAASLISDSGGGITITPVPNTNKEDVQPEIVNEAWEDYLTSRMEQIDESLLEDIKGTEDKKNG